MTTNRALIHTLPSSYTDRVILHIDGDAFFASVEQVKQYQLKGKPIVTGGERYIAAAMSYEAKARGVTRGMRLSDIRKVCPEAIICDSDYVTYTIFARRMYDIVRQYTDIVEEYSIDECFADITGMDAVYGMSYAELGYHIKQELERKLGLTFGVGLAHTKVLAKIASKQHKPAGYTVIGVDMGDTEKVQDSHVYDRIELLRATPIERVWGIGSATTRTLLSHRIYTAYDFISLSQSDLSALKIAKPYRDIYHELHGVSVLGVTAEPPKAPQSVMCTKTFGPPTSDPAVIYAQLSKNVEKGCEKLRIHKVFATACSFFIKSQDFRYYRREYRLPVPTNDPTEILKLIKQDMIALCAPHLQYRATGISLMGLRSGMQDRMQARTLFDIDVRKDDSDDNGDDDIDEKKDTHANVDYVNATVAGSDSGSRVRTGMDSGSNSISSTVAGSAMRAVLQHVDTLNQRFGEHAVMLGSSLHAVKTRVKYRAPTYRTHHAQPSYTPPFSSDRTWEIPLVGTVKVL
jgi:DNA polymerase IV